MSIKVDITNHCPEVKEALANAIERALMVIGETAVDYAAEACPKRSGNLAGSITHMHESDGGHHEVIIGTNVEYGKYVELGTGIYAEGGGRQTPWSYVGEDGEWHYTHGQSPQPFLRPAAADHAEEYREILIESLKNA